MPLKIITNNKKYCLGMTQTMQFASFFGQLPVIRGLVVIFIQLFSITLLELIYLAHNEVTIVFMFVWSTISETDDVTFYGMHTNCSIML